MKVDQATGLCGGVVVAKRAKLPRSRSPARFGRSAQCRSTNPGSMPSTPITITCLPLATERARHPEAAMSINNNTAVTHSRKAYYRLSFHPRRILDAEQT